MEDKGEQQSQDCTTETLLETRAAAARAASVARSYYPGVSKMVSYKYLVQLAAQRS